MTKTTLANLCPICKKRETYKNWWACFSCTKKMKIDQFNAKLVEWYNEIKK